MKHFDVIVVGGGHAGAEAAAASARMGAQTALVTLSHEKTGTMSCNPAIGGLGKGHLVREIDAMDGIMGVAADCAGIQFRLLNRRKGPAVQGPRAQADRALYRQAIQSILARQAGLSVVEGEVASLIMQGQMVSGVRLRDGSEITARSVVLTAGTFLNGIIHIGDQKTPGGRVGDAPSQLLAGQLSDVLVGGGRLKTGTPPRLDGRTIDWDRLEMQPGDDDPVLFSFLHDRPIVRQISCGITHTNERTHQIVRDNLSRSAMYGGHIEGVGPRYCPSIEDKVVRFSDKESHQVFLEPEGLDDHTVYPNGISTSLPAEVQEGYVRTIVGLENVRITQPGYAIEYDFFDPKGLDGGLRVKGVPGLYIAGQINGTTGYEEAAAQGLVAGLTAAADAMDRAAPVFSRSSSYIGVMIDDLILRGVTEPYRMFTSRAEFRLSLRADNADQRLTAMGREFGCVGDRRWEAYNQKAEALDALRSKLCSRRFSPQDLAAAGITVSKDGVRRDGIQVLGMPGLSDQSVSKLLPELSLAPVEIATQIQREALYAQYLGRQQAEAEALRSDEDILIPAGFPYLMLPGLSAELAAKLDRIRPQNLGAAGRIEGITPAALALLLVHIRRNDLRAVGS